MRAIKAVVTSRSSGSIKLEMENGVRGWFTTNKPFRLYQRVSVLFDTGKMEIKEVLSEQECLDLDRVPDLAGDDLSDVGDASEVVENIEVDVIPEDLSVPER